MPEVNNATNIPSDVSVYTGPTREVKQTLDKDAFLNLLLTQIKNQDPLEPLNDQDFIAQLAQFSQLEQSEKLNQGFEEMSSTMMNTQAFSMIGKYVSYSVDNGDGFTTKYGTVGSVRVTSDGTQLVIGDDVVDLDKVGEVSSDTSSDSAIALLGRRIEFYTENEEGGYDRENGVVQAVQYMDGEAFLEVSGDKIVPYAGVLSVSEA